MNHLSIDIETKSSEDIKSVGAYKYARAEDFEILLFAYKVDDTDTKIIDFTANEKIPEDIINALSDKSVIKHAYNAAFEWYCLNRAGIETPIDQWRCTMIHAMYCGYPAGLGATGEAIGIPEDKQKLKEGKALINYFCKPCKPTKVNGGRTWNRPEHDPVKWANFKRYCIQDVEAEYIIDEALKLYPVPLSEEIQWQYDTLMNARGARVDTKLIEGSNYVDENIKAQLTKKAKELTCLSNPNSTAQLLAWLRSNGINVDNTTKATVQDLLDGDLPSNIRQVLELRQQLGKSSVAKYKKMVETLCDDDRIRGLSQFYGASATGRWAGRLVQIQNLPRNSMKTLDVARKAVIGKNIDFLKMVYTNIPDALSQLVRTAFIPSDGNKLVVADFSAIEARVIAWLAGETWVNEVFATHGKIYEATASNMFHVPFEKIKKGNPEYSLRQKGKVATLALGYQGGVGALIAMNAVKMGIAEEELPDIVSRWRRANPNIVGLWGVVDRALIKVLSTAEPQVIHKGVRFEFVGDNAYNQRFLTVELPSKRKLYYANPKIVEGGSKFGKDAVFYKSLNQTTKKYELTATYGGKMTENIVQAIARDCLAETLIRLNNEKLNYIFHVHDEVIIDASKDLTVDYVCDLMSEPIPWAKGLVLKAAGFESEYYMKD